MNKNIFELVKSYGLENVIKHYGTFNNEELLKELLKLNDSDKCFILGMLNINTGSWFYKFLRKELTYKYNSHPIKFDEIEKIEGIMQLMIEHNTILS